VFAAHNVPAGHDTDTYASTAHNATHVVSVPEASSPAALVVPAGHDTHAFADTYSSTAHNVATHVVSVPEASSFAALVVPAGHDTHAFADTYSSTAHNVASHAVSVPEASSPAALVVPAGHDTHALATTRWSARHMRRIDHAEGGPSVDVLASLRSYSKRLPLNIHAASVTAAVFQASWLKASAKHLRGVSSPSPCSKQRRRR
jgi:acetoin utilization deacetylase AcuC-like enzyme